MSRHSSSGWAAQRIRAWVLAEKGTVCHLCGGDGADSADHLIPLSAGGARTALSNLAPAHQACNAARADLPLGEWFARHPLPHRPTLAPSRDW